MNDVVLRPQPSVTGINLQKHDYRHASGILNALAFGDPTAIMLYWILVLIYDNSPNASYEQELRRTIT